MIGDKRLLTRPSKPGNPPWDNEEHDLILHTGDVIYDGVKKYSVISLLGKGTFGQVVNCIDHESEKNCAVKVSKSPRIYYSCSRLEAQILERLKLLNSKHFVDIYSTFIFKQHHCIVMELLGRNLYEMLKIRNFTGFSHTTVRDVLRQLLYALVDMAKIGVVHCDLKPENILVDDPHSMKVKIIDFGSAFYHFKENSFYVQSRYYRAPEVMMSMAYNSSVDVWSFACIAFELLVGRPLFPGKSNADQLARIFYLLDDTSHINRSAGDTADSVEHKDTFLTKEDVRRCIYSSSKSHKDNQSFYDFLFLVLKIRAVERPGPITILNYGYLNETPDFREKSIVLEHYGSVEARNQQHPPPQTLEARRHTSSTMKAKDKEVEGRRKKSLFKG